MQRDSKLNKSPIESIIHQSFTEISASSKENDIDSKMFEQNRINKFADAEQFKCAAENNVINMQQQLKIVQLISMTQLEIAVESIVNVLRNKVLNTLTLSYHKIKTAELNKNIHTAINKGDKSLVAKRVCLFYQKVNSIVNLKKLRNLGSCFVQLYLHSKRVPIIEKSSSTASPFRNYSKVQNSERGESDWELAQSHGGGDPYQQLAKENRRLKKKKEKIKTSQSEFCNKINQMLSSHEAFLDGK